MKLLKKIDIDFILPYLVALFPFVHLVAVNIKEIQLIDTLRTFIIIIFFVSLANLLLYKTLLRISKKNKMSFVLSLLIVVGFSFGHLVSFIKSFMIKIYFSS